MPIIIIAILILIGIVLSIVNSIIGKQELKKKVIITNGALYAIIAVLIIFSVAEHFILKRDSVDYDIKGKDILCEYYYDRTEGDYYILLQSQFLSPPSEIPALKSDVKLPVITHFYKPVAVYRDSDDRIVKLRPNYSVLYCVIGLIDFIVLLLFNIWALISIIKKGRIRS